MSDSLIPFIDLRSQYEAVRDTVNHRIAAVLDHGRYIMGPEVGEMEAALAACTGSEHCIAAASGTDALLMSLMALGIGSGDEVIIPAFTFAATAEVVILAGAIPVLVDIEPDTCNISTGAIDGAVTERTRAIMPVSLYGQPADMTEINSIAAVHRLAVVEDAAQSFGATYNNRGSCALSTLGCTSFFPSKPLGCYGDGGAIFTDDVKIAQACREIRVHGQSKRYHHTRIGVGGRMDTLQCAIVLAKLERFAWEIERRLEIGARYNRLIDDRGIARIVQRADRTSVFAQYTVLVDERSRVRQALEAAGIPTTVHYPAPINRQPAYAGRCVAGPLPYADAAAERVLSLPMHPYLDEALQDRIVDRLSEAVSGQR